MITQGWPIWSGHTSNRQEQISETYKASYAAANSHAPTLPHPPRNAHEIKVTKYVTHMNKKTGTRFTLVPACQSPSILPPAHFHPSVKSLARAPLPPLSAASMTVLAAFPSCRCCSSACWCFPSHIATCWRQNASMNCLPLLTFPSSLSAAHFSSLLAMYPLFPFPPSFLGKALTDISITYLVVFCSTGSYVDVLTASTTLFKLILPVRTSIVCFSAFTTTCSSM